MDNTQLKNVIVFQHDELAYHPERYPDYKPELFYDISVCSLEYDLPKIKRSVSFYHENSSPTAGETYVRSPFDSKVFVSISELNDYIIQEKITCIFDIARTLGACKMNGSFYVKDAFERQWDAKIKGQAKLIQCDTSVNIKKQNELNKQYKIQSSQTGRHISQEDWNNAKEKAEKYNLIADPTVRNLLNALNPSDNGGNHDISQHITFSMSAETNKSLDIAFNLNSVKGLFALNSDFHSSTKYKYEIFVNIDFEFPK